MADRISPHQRSLLMTQIKGEHTKPELTVRKLLFSMGYRYRLHVSNLPGKPDVVLTRFKKVIFVHGCFWHGHVGCPRGKRPTSNRTFWDRKLNRNIQRDLENQEVLKKAGWDILVIWECETRELEGLNTRLRDFFAGDIHGST